MEGALIVKMTRFLFLSLFFNLFSKGIFAQKIVLDPAEKDELDQFLEADQVNRESHQIDFWMSLIADITKTDLEMTDLSTGISPFFKLERPSLLKPS